MFNPFCLFFCACAYCHLTGQIFTPRPCDLFADSNGVFSPKKVGLVTVVDLNLEEV